jgi:ketopantoate reductase
MVFLTTKGLYAEPYHSLSVGVSTLGRYTGASLVLAGEDVAVPVCDPELESLEVGGIYVDADNLDVEQIEPAPGQELLPNRIEAAEVLPTLNTYSLPINL